MPTILIGALLALVLASRPGYGLLARPLGSRWASAALLVAALFLWRNPQVPEGFMHLTLAALTAACVLREGHLLARLLKWRTLVHIGTVSYGIYLMHMLCHNAVERVLARIGFPFAPLDFALTALVVVLAATVSHRHFEARFLPADKRLQTRGSK